MGNSESFTQPQEHPRFSKVQYSLNNDAMIVREPIVSKTKQLNAWLEKRKLLAHVYNSPALFICKQYQIQQKAVCSDSAVFIGNYEGVFERTLKQQIKIRAQETRYFREEDIWYLTLLVAKNCSQIYEHGLNHFIGNIHPHNILLNKKGQYKLIVSNYSFSMPALLDHFKEFQLSGDSQAFVSPEMTGFLYSTKYAEYPNYPRCINRQTAQAFCFGATLLSMATLTQNIGKLYKGFSVEKRRSTMDNSVNSISSLRSTNSKINITSSSPLSSSDHLSQLLQSVKNRYSSVLYQLILGLIEKDPQARLGIDKAYNQLLKPIEREILIFDSSWIQKLKEKEQSEQEENILKQSKQFCRKWARHQSYILKDE